jgi:hypothetical protein
MHFTRKKCAKCSLILGELEKERHSLRILRRDRLHSPQLQGVSHLCCLIYKVSIRQRSLHIVSPCKTMLGITKTTRRDYSF